MHRQCSDRASSGGDSKITTLTFKDAWVFPEEVEKRIANAVIHNPGKWLNAPVGTSDIGRGPFNEHIEMTTFDKDPQLNPDVEGDIFRLNDFFKPESFDGVISDPIWYTYEKNKTVGLAYHQRRYLSYQIRDVLKPGGLWIFNGLWNPIVKGLKIIRVEVPMQAYSSFRNVSLLIYLKKVNETL